MPSALPAADLASLPKSDGSASFSHLGYTVTSSVNGPIEAPRRDENAFEALVDVNVRPAAGVGGKYFYFTALPAKIWVGAKATGQEPRRDSSSRFCRRPCDRSSL